jgi:hypothetical protein
MLKNRLVMANWADFAPPPEFIISGVFVPEEFNRLRGPAPFDMKLPGAFGRCWMDGLITVFFKLSIPCQVFES